MITLLFCILMFAVFGRLAAFAFRAAWGVTKIIACFVLMPIFLIVLLLSGLVYIAFPILIVVGVIGFLSSRA